MDNSDKRQQLRQPLVQVTAQVPEELRAWFKQKAEENFFSESRMIMVAMLQYRELTENSEAEL